MQSTRNPVTEHVTPDPDGVQTTFQTSQPYRSGTLSIWVNGMRKIAQWDDGFVELGGSAIVMKEAPLTNDSVQARYDV